ncbi:hypothetical protein PG985_013899 [Apiospora marii]|uniref:uncharacterized protein n=1 Tax=Apiospora marii TaxID=335849 RepID=UPI003131A624
MGPHPLHTHIGVVVKRARNLLNLRRLAVDAASVGTRSIAQLGQKSIREVLGGGVVPRGPHRIDERRDGVVDAHPAAVALPALGLLLLLRLRMLLQLGRLGRRHSRIRFACSLLAEPLLEGLDLALLAKPLPDTLATFPPALGHKHLAPGLLLFGEPLFL